MAHRDRHELDCLHLLQKPMWEVHAWLDEMSQVFPVELFIDYHRSFRHNSWGVQQCLEMWGSDGEKAARIHLLRDWNLDVPIKHLNLAEALRQSDEALIHFNMLDEEEYNHLLPHQFRHWQKWMDKGMSIVECARKDGLFDRGLSKWQIKRAAEKSKFYHF